MYLYCILCHTIRCIFTDMLSLLFAVITRSSIYRYCILFHAVRYIVSGSYFIRSNISLLYTIYTFWYATVWYCYTQLDISLLCSVSRIAIYYCYCVLFMQFDIPLLYTISRSSIYRYCTLFHAVRYVVNVHCFTQLDISLPCTVRILRSSFWVPFTTLHDWFNAVRVRQETSSID
jgi:hypothetical protein